MYGVSVRAAMRAETFFSVQRRARDALRRKEHIAKLVPLGKRRRAALAQSGLDLVDLAEGLQLRRARVMGANRVELSGFTDAMRDRLRAYGLFSEIISWKLRFFVPTDASGPSILAKVLERFPVERIGEREAA